MLNMYMHILPGEENFWQERSTNENYKYIYNECMFCIGYIQSLYKECKFYIGYTLEILKFVIDPYFDPNISRLSIIQIHQGDIVPEMFYFPIWMVSECWKNVEWTADCKQSMNVNAKWTMNDLFWMSRVFSSYYTCIYYKIRLWIRIKNWMKNICSADIPRLN